MTPHTGLRFGTAWEEHAFDGSAAWTGMHETFCRAAAVAPSELCETWLELAGRPACLRVVGRELACHIVRPFAHLEGRPSAAAELVIEIWDDRFAGALPPPERTEGETQWREATLHSSDGRFVAQQLPHTISCLDRDASRIVAGIAWHERIFIYERSKPLARLLLNWHNDRDVQVIHTGLIARNGTGVLLAGKSGSGKSTTTLLSVMAGLDYLSEDYVGLETRPDGTFVGHSLYNSVFLNSAHLDRFPDLARHAIRGRPPQEEKSVLILSQLCSERLRRSVPIRALVFPQVNGAALAHLSPMPKPAALLALAPSSLLQIPNRRLGATGFGRLAALVERLPCLRLTVGSDTDSIPRRLEELIAQVRHD